MRVSQYIAGKYCTFQLENGKIVTCAPGDDVPADAILQNHHLWIKHGYIVQREGKVIGDAPRTSLPARVSTEADRLRGQPGPLPMPGDPIPSLMAPTFNDSTVKRDFLSRNELEAMNRPELIELGRRAGLTIATGEKKSNVVDAIMTAQT